MVFFSCHRCRSLAGFSLAETLLSAFVLTAGIVVIVTMISKSLGDSIESRDAIIGAELAQEGIELVRNVRDNDFAAGNNGFSLFDGDRHCRIDYDDPVDSFDCDGSFGGGNRYALEFTNGAYAHTDTAARFSRYVYTDYDDSVSGEENALVRSFVYWGNYTPPPSGDPGGCSAQNKCVFTEIVLTNWK